MIEDPFEKLICIKDTPPLVDQNKLRSFWLRWNHENLTSKLK